MTTKELNRDIKRLASEFYRHSFLSDGENLQFIQNEGKKEFLRLYFADKKFEYMNRDNILSMLKLNLRFQFVPLHQFRIHIEY